MATTRTVVARRLTVTGVVQGVGFRPFVHRLAVRLGLTGWVKNVAGSVEILVEGGERQVAQFESALQHEAPSVARVDAVQSLPADAVDRDSFAIVASADADALRPVPPDVAICAHCAQELFDPANRRYQHPFITCTDCGPRYSIIDGLPYDRERTAMREFAPCSRCAAEYAAPEDRRFHAETVACHDCGPSVWFEGPDGGGRSTGHSAILLAATALRMGAVVGVRGVGGFHLAVDATNDAAVRRLRARKHRDAKPLAVMVRTLDDARAVAHVTHPEAALLTSAASPIVLLRPRDDAPLAPSLAPGLDRVGILLAYTPLHHLLLKETGRPLVMTSGNVSDEPIAIGIGEGRARLRPLVDAFLLHDREILSRCDDSVVRLCGAQPIILRRARGYAPVPVRLPSATPVPLIAVGPHLKNTFTLARDVQAFVSPHIGDLEGIEALEHWQQAFARYRTLFRVEPEVAVRDLHPGYLSTRIAEELGLRRVIAVQHHHAHLAAVAAEHGVTTPVVGLAFDGTGYGDDGHTWGGEVLISDLAGYRRVGQLRYVPLPGGDVAAREPWRVALGYEAVAGWHAEAFALAYYGIPLSVRAGVQQQLTHDVNAPLASSMGRLFDAAAAVLGVRRHASFEGQAAMELEALAGDVAAPPLPFPTFESEGRLHLDPLPLLMALGEGRRHGVDVAVLAARFHESIVEVSVDVVRLIAASYGLDTVVLGGGAFQNARLLARITRRLTEARLRVLTARTLGPNDNAISYGQAAVAAWTLTHS
ncbi:MAG: carbamoyltransferase HypF [Gemmatimonadaceae bacterium]|nr:carbamoyltransferase HypF [Gemmatimonadaceae bacterium]